MIMMFNIMITRSSEASGLHATARQATVGGGAHQVAQVQVHISHLEMMRSRNMLMRMMMMMLPSNRLWTTPLAKLWGDLMSSRAVLEKTASVCFQALLPWSHHHFDNGHVDVREYWLCCEMGQKWHWWISQLCHLVRYTIIKRWNSTSPSSHWWFQYLHSRLRQKLHKKDQPRRFSRAGSQYTPPSKALIILS